MSNTITRRTLARGAAWAVPAVTVAAAAPAYATSPATNGPMTFSWQGGTWSPKGSTSSLTGDVIADNSFGRQAVSLLSATVYTTFHTPATNTGQQTLATIDLTGTSIFAHSWISLGLNLLDTTSKAPLVRPLNGTDDITLSYYSGTSDGTVACTPNLNFVQPGQARYPYFPTRLVSDQTRIVFTYAAGGVTYIGVVDSTLGQARVMGNCT
jgi:hypothetical protein